MGSAYTSDLILREGLRTVKFWMAPTLFRWFSQTHFPSKYSDLLTLIPKSISQLLLFCFHLSGPPCSSAPHWTCPFLSNDFFLAWHLLCVYLYTELEATSSSCFGSSRFLAYFLPEMSPSYPQEVRHTCYFIPKAPSGPWPCSNCLFVLYLLTFLSPQIIPTVSNLRAVTHI